MARKAGTLRLKRGQRISSRWMTMRVTLQALAWAPILLSPGV
jgi:hypothetical protein